MTDMVERCGLALLNDDRVRNGWPAVDSLSHLIDADADAYRSSARAAIAAMREPSRAMWAAGGNAIVGYKQRHHDKVVERVWSGMIDASLNESPHHD